MNGRLEIKTDRLNPSSSGRRHLRLDRVRASSPLVFSAAALCLVSGCLFSSALYAQDSNSKPTNVAGSPSKATPKNEVTLAKKSNFQIQHTPPTALPPIGSLVKLSFTLIPMLSSKQNIDAGRSTDQQVQATVVLDGQLMVIPVRNIVLDDRDRPRFEVTFNAPVGELSYAVTVLDVEGGVSSSRRYELKRTCLPQVELSDTTLVAQGPETDKPRNGRAVLDELLVKTNVLKSEVDQLDRAIKEMEELHGMMEKRQ